MVQISDLPLPNTTTIIPRRPILLVKLTAYRILIVILTTGFGASKAALALRGISAVPSSLDLTFGVFVTLALWWLGLYEAVDPPIAPWFFHVDYSHRSIDSIQLIYRRSLPVVTWLWMRMYTVIRSIVRGTFAYILMMTVMIYPMVIYFISTNLYLFCILLVVWLFLFHIVLRVETKLVWLHKLGDSVNDFFDSLSASDFWYGTVTVVASVGITLFVFIFLL